MRDLCYGLLRCTWTRASMQFLIGKIQGRRLKLANTVHAVNSVKLSALRSLLAASDSPAWFACFVVLSLPFCLWYWSNATLLPLLSPIFYIPFTLSCTRTLPLPHGVFPFLLTVLAQPNLTFFCFVVIHGTFSFPSIFYVTYLTFSLNRFSQIRNFYYFYFLFLASLLFILLIYGILHPYKFIKCIKILFFLLNIFFSKIYYIVLFIYLFNITLQNYNLIILFVLLIL